MVFKVFAVLHKNSVLQNWAPRHLRWQSPYASEHGVYYMVQSESWSASLNETYSSQTIKKTLFEYQGSQNF